MRSCSSGEGIGIKTFSKPLALMADILPDEICFFIWSWNCLVRVKYAIYLGFNGLLKEKQASCITTPSSPNQAVPNPISSMVSPAATITTSPFSAILRFLRLTSSSLRNDLLSFAQVP